MALDLLAGLFSSALLAGSVLALAGLGETVAQRAGVFNLGVEGFMAMGGISAIMVVAATGQPYLGCLGAVVVGAAMGAGFAVTSVTLRVNQVTGGLAFSFLGLGASAWIGTTYAGQPAVASFERISIPLLSDLPILGPLFFDHHLLTYFTFLIAPVGLHVLLFRTRLGLNILAVGENPAAADASGIPVNLVRGCCVVFGCAMSALAGAYLTLVFVPTWSDGITAGRGWIAFALVIFAGYNPVRLTISALFFGLISSFSFLAQTWSWSIPSAFLTGLPYLATLGILILPWLLRKPNLSGNRPAALGAPYVREER